MSERIALTVGFEAMRRLGVSTQPEVLLDKILLVSVEGGQRHYRILFSHSEDSRKHPYRSEVTIRADMEKSLTKWVDGVVEIFHWAAEAPWSASFTVTWALGIPRVEVGSIVC